MMQATMRTDSKFVRGGKLLSASAVAVAVAAALTLGFAVGYATAPGGHATSTVNMSRDSDGLSATEKQITHGALP